MSNTGDGSGGGIGDGSKVDSLDTVVGAHPKTISCPNPSCIIHLTNAYPESNLVCQKDDSSWQTLLTAAQIRNHKPILDIAKDIPSGQCPVL